MADATLIIGNKNYSSWSLRAWLALKMANIPFEEIVVPLDTPEFQANIAKYSPSRRVPALIADDLHIWDSLAIMEWVAEQKPALWPSDATARAHARSITAEMHSGFPALRHELPMNLRRTVAPVEMSAACRNDIARIQGLWQDARERFGDGGAFLFRHFSLADAMYAPVVTRFVTYDVEMNQATQSYCREILNLEPMRQWIDAARSEPWVIDAEER